VAQVAKDAASGTPSIKTYVLGIGTELAALDQVAKAGGTSKAYLAASGQVSQKLLDVLNQIRLTGVCQFQIPVPTSGTPDYNKVNVNFTPNGGQAQPVGNVKDSASCDPAKGGWYYDNKDKPTKIILCDGTCDQVKLSSQPVNILLGCQTLVY